MNEALLAFSTLVQYAVESGWHGAHNLAKLAVPDRPLSGENERGELEWWKDTVLNAAKEAAAKPVIQTDEGMLPALCDEADQAASFLVPAISADAAPCIDYDAMHEVASAITSMYLPSKTHRAGLARNRPPVGGYWCTGCPSGSQGTDRLHQRTGAFHHRSARPRRRH